MQQVSHKSACNMFHEQQISMQQVSRTKKTYNMFHEEKYQERISFMKELYHTIQKIFTTSLTKKTKIKNSFTREKLKYNRVHEETINMQHAS